MSVKSTIFKVGRLVIPLIVIAWPVGAYAAGLSRAEAEVAFIEAGVHYCLPAIQNGLGVDEISDDELNGLESFEDKGVPKRTENARLWTVSGTGGVVQIEDLKGEYCRVSSYGIAASNVFQFFEAPVELLGFVEDKENVPQRKGQIQRGFIKTEEGIQYRLFLSGAEVPSVRSSVVASFSIRQVAE